MAGAIKAWETDEALPLLAAGVALLLIWPLLQRGDAVTAKLGDFEISFARVFNQGAQTIGAAVQESVEKAKEELPAAKEVLERIEKDVSDVVRRTAETTPASFVRSIYTSGTRPRVSHRVHFGTVDLTLSAGPFAATSVECRVRSPRGVTYTTGVLQWSHHSIDGWTVTFPDDFRDSVHLTTMPGDIALESGEYAVEWWEASWGLPRHGRRLAKDRFAMSVSDLM